MTDLNKRDFDAAIESVHGNTIRLTVKRARKMAEEHDQLVKAVSVARYGGKALIRCATADLQSRTREKALMLIPPEIKIISRKFEIEFPDSGGSILIAGPNPEGIESFTGMAFKRL